VINKPAEKITKWAIKITMSNIEDLKRAGLKLYGMTTGRHLRLKKLLVADRTRWKDVTAASMNVGLTYRMII